MYISLGFLLAATEENVDEIKRVAKDHGLSACRIGKVDESKMVKLSLGSDACVMFDFSKGSVLTPKNHHQQG